MDMKKNISILLLAFTVLAATPQKEDYKEDMLKVRDVLSNEHLSFTVTYDVYASHTGSKNIQQSVMNYYIWNDLMYSTSKEVDLLVNKDVSLFVDHTQKVVTVNKYNADDRKKLQKDLSVAFGDTIWRNIADYQLVHNADGYKEWKITYKRNVSNMASSIIRIKVPEYYITHSTILYNASFNDIYGTSPAGVSLTEKPRLEIAYTNYTKLVKEDKEKYFEVEKIVQLQKNGKGVLNPRYKKYTLANYYNVKP